MTFVSIRDMRTRPGEVWEQLQAEGDLILTSSGRPFALMIAAEGEDIEELLLAAEAVLVSGNLRHYPVEQRDGVVVLAPGSFLEDWQEQS